MKNNFKNAIYNGIGFIVPILIALFTTPYIVHKLGTDLYGIYVLCISIIGFMSFFDLGFGTGIIKFVSQYEAKGDFEKINKIVNTALVVNTFMGLLGAISIFFFSDYLAVHLFKVKIENQYISEIAFKITAIGFLIVLLNGVFSNIPKALQRYDVATKIQTSIWIVSTLSTVIILYLGFSLKEVFLLWIFFQILGLIAYYYTSKLLLPSLNINFIFSIEVFKEIFGFSMFTAMNSITGNIVFRVDKMIVGAILGASFVTYYQVSFMIVQMANGFISAISQHLFPLFSKLNSFQDVNKIKNLFLNSTSFILVLSLIINTLLLINGTIFLVKWMGQDFANNSGLVLPILSSAFFLMSIGATMVRLADGLGFPQLNTLSSTVGSFLYIFSAIILSHLYQLNGVALSFWFVLAPYPLYIYKICKIIDLKQGIIYKIYLKLALIITALLFGFILQKTFIPDLEVKYLTKMVDSFIAIILIFILSISLKILDWYELKKFLSKINI